jgi:hypothetical protein
MLRHKGMIFAYVFQQLLKKMFDYGLNIIYNILIQIL